MAKKKMSKSINILDKEYVQWVKSLVERYRQSQIKAAVKVNTVQLFFNLSLGKDIAEREAENKYGTKFYAILSKDLKRDLPDVEGLSESNIRYCKRFYQLYKDVIENLPQLVEISDMRNLPQVVEKLCSIPWGHQRLIIDRCSDNPQESSGTGTLIRKSEANKCKMYDGTYGSQLMVNGS